MRRLSISRVIILAMIICLAVGLTAFTAGASSSKSDVSNPSLEIVSNNVSYSDSIYILYAISNEGFDRTEYEIKMLFWNEARESYALGTEDYSTANEGVKKVKGKDCLIFYSNGLAAKEMTDDLYARACVVIGDEEYYSDVMKFSVLEYVHTMREQGNIGQGQIKLFTTMLEYGTAAQNNFNHNTSRPANGAYHKINVKGGHHSDGFDHGRYLEGNKVILTPNKAPNGMRFSHWIDENGIIVSYDKLFEITVGKGGKTYEAIFKDISSIATQLKLTAEVPYDAGVEDIDLPTAVTFEAGGESIVLEVSWDTSVFVTETIGKQTLYATLNDTGAYAEYGIEPGSITMEVTTLPYTYEVDQTSGEYILTGYYGTDTAITVPTSYRNVFITRIASKAFNNVQSLVSVTVPYSVTVIENGAFWYCDNIEDITLPFIGESASSSSSWLGWIFGANAYDVQHGLLPLALETVTLADGATKIPDYAFYSCAQITSINTPDSITSLGYRSFYGCSITEFTLPDGLTAFHDSFLNCFNLKRINVNSVDMLFNIYMVSAASSKGQSIFAEGADLYCNGNPVTELVIPRDVTSIGMGLFTGCTSIRSIYIPASVTEIRFAAFTYMTSLEAVVFEEGSSIETLSYTFSGCTSLTSVNLEALTQLTKINCLFSECTSLSEITLPDSLLDMGIYSFKNTGITSIILPDGIQKIGTETFWNCAALESITIPSGVVEIADNAFRGCTSLSSVQLPTSLTALGNYAFAYCSSLGEITIPERVYSIGSGAFTNTSLARITVLSTRLSEIGSGAFDYCNILFEIYNLSPLTFTLGAEDNGKIALNAKVIHTSLDAETRVNIDENGFITYFDGVDNLLLKYVGSSGDIVLPDYEGVTYRILDEAFGYTAVKLNSVVIPDCVTEIGNSAFNSQDKLYFVRIGAGVTYIGDSAFYGCYRLAEVVNDSKSITLTKGASDNGYIAQYAIAVYNSDDSFSGTKIEYKDGYVIYTDGENVVLVDPGLAVGDFVIPSYITEIGGYAFYSNSGITSVVIPNGVTSIGMSAFFNCTSLTSITIPKSVTFISEYAFFNCTSLTSITIPEGVTSIGSDAFGYCTSLTSVTIPKSVTFISAYAFDYCTNLKDVYYGGSETDWASVTIPSDNTALTRATIHYNYTTEE